MLSETSTRTSKNSNGIAFIKYNAEPIFLLQFDDFIQRSNLTRILELQKISWKRIFQDAYTIKIKMVSILSRKDDS